MNELYKIVLRYQNKTQTQTRNKSQRKKKSFVVMLILMIVLVKLTTETILTLEGSGKLHYESFLEDLNLDQHYLVNKFMILQILKVL